MFKTFNDIINSVIALIRASLPVGSRIDTRVGTVLRDAILSPLSNILAGLYQSAQIMYKNWSVDTYVDSSALDRIGANYGVVRSSGSYATGLVRLYRSIPPAADIVVSVGTSVTAANNNSQVVFSSTSTATMYGSGNSLANLVEQDQDSPFYGYYYIEIPVQCTTAGTVGNVGAGSIRTVGVSGFDGVDNPNNFDNGKDTQTDVEMVSIIKSTARGNTGTVYGYESLVSSNFTVGDIQVIPFDDADAIRNQVSGSLDIIVMSNGISTITEVFPSSRSISPSYKPLLGVSSVVVLPSDVPLVSGVDYVVQIDNSSIYRRSIADMSTITIGSAVPLNASDTIKVVYTYAGDILNMQNFISAPENKVLGADVLMKLGIPVPVKIGFSMKVLPGYDFDVLKPQVISAIQTHFSALTLGVGVQVSDIIDVAYTVPGVDFISTASGAFGFYKVSSTGAVISSNLDTLSVTKSEYITLADAALVGTPTNPDITAA